ncbi:site-specific DNA-methyltransferase [Vibrio parahaemolyticus]|uniref:site-specific DNA-methyltransferase n=1 Tax=Vibrio parahaemolyticus TaxID=670 RepID=UPI00215C4738|nr:site-specific DNA-methyltransferase [Vibrio parahaemolyticus]MCR9730212.1 site-specific DNA-methyltransferase [Vibrio parahaemolyticus]MCR9751030.1 site-specific DNA-methyltransferase [Vibrio parahaemolyticus]MCR9788513.1 site-specific DNA-methyltransferase [Vibrio parahaemolyticus]MCR9861965.1 site-specific DNA-methyltransferase [Vibrio parahaemolyticus]
MANEEQQTNVEKYEFEPIKGYPMLNWKGKRPFRSTQYFPAQLKEVYGHEDDNGWINKIFWGDNLQVMSHLLKDYRGKVNLIYIDPPFDSKVDYKREIKLKGEKIKSDSTSFEEKQYGDVWSNDEYLQFMYERLIIAKELLSETGSIYLHCDWHKSHHLRCVMDEIFGNGGEKGKSGGFKNEISWCYSDAANSKTQWNTKHDIILFYTKSATWTFNYKSVLREMSESSIKKYKYTDEDGNKYRLFGKNIQGSPIQWHRDVPPEWENSHPELVYRHYMKEGSLPLDWWTINPVNQAAKERTGYPTQKPQELLERIIKASSNEGDLVFDFFMGSGTLQSVANNLGRKFIGADINLGAIQTTTKRLYSQKASFEVYNVNNYDVFRNPVEAKDLLIEALEIQKLDSNVVYDGEKDGYKVKIMPVNRIATKEDLNELVANFPYKKFEERKAANPNKPVEEIMLVCMGHEPGLGATLENECGYKLKVEVVDILRDKSDLTFKYDSEAVIKVQEGKLIVDAFYPRNLLQKLSQQKDDVAEWREMVESIMIDWNYDGAVMEPVVIDIPDKNEFVAGEYEIPQGASNIKIKITDLLSESYEEVIAHG